MHSSNSTSIRRLYGTLLKPCWCVTKDVVNGSLDQAVLVVLIPGMGVKSILISIESTAIKTLLVTIACQGNGLTPFSIRVGHIDVVHPKVIHPNIQRRASLVTARCSSALGMRNSYLITSIGRDVAGVTVDGQCALVVIDDDLLIVCARVKEDARRRR